MKWSVTLMIAGAAIFAFGFLPPYASGVTIDTLEAAASLFAVGIFVFLVGFLVRKIARTLK